MERVTSFGLERYAVVFQDGKGGPQDAFDALTYLNLNLVDITRLVQC